MMLPSAAKLGHGPTLPCLQIELGVPHRARANGTKCHPSRLSLPAACDDALVDVDASLISNRIKTSDSPLLLLNSHETMAAIVVDPDLFQPYQTAHKRRQILYYVLVAACVTFRKAEWLRNACLAAALVLPAISALHGLVLAFEHVNGVVDMDLYGAFQLCSIGILAAPLTVRLSRTYFYDRRNLIFLWTILILCGLVALCVESYRVTPMACEIDGSGRENLSAATFPYGGNTSCGLTCSEELGPFSTLRGGAAANVNVIPVPKILTFNALMLLSAGFCIPAILSLIFTWDKILEINWKRRRDTERLDERIEGANITVGEMKGINRVVRLFLSVVEIPLFGGVILTIIGIGEANFFSPQVNYDTEPMGSIGQWSPLAGTCLATMGSLYLLWAGGEDVTERSRTQYTNSEASRRSHSNERDLSPSRSSVLEQSPNRSDIRSASPHDIGLIPTITGPDLEHQQSDDARSCQSEPTAGRNKVRKWFTSAANYMGNAAHEKLDVSGYNDEKAHRFPEIPGEDLRNPALERVSTQYSQLRKKNSRAGSTYASSIASTSGAEGSPTSKALQGSPRPESSPTRVPARRATLEVPTPAHTHRRSESH
ncbi:Nn.00g072650.m01.CDS01 [Neocucurbitaria sp. VM-36]